MTMNLSWIDDFTALASTGNFSVGFDLLGAAFEPISGELFGDVLDIVAEQAELELELTGRYVHQLPADSSDFLKVGVPVIAFVGAPLYLYDEADTLDKVAKQDLNKVARAFAHMVERIVHHAVSKGAHRVPVRGKAFQPAKRSAG